MIFYCIMKWMLYFFLFFFLIPFFFFLFFKVQSFAVAVCIHVLLTWMILVFKMQACCPSIWGKKEEKMGQDWRCMTPNTVAVEHYLFFIECHVISAVLQLYLSWSSFNAEKCNMHVCLLFSSKFHFKQNTSVEFIFLFLCI